jgi:hypothetical protein
MVMARLAAADHELALRALRRHRAWHDAVERGASAREQRALRRAWQRAATRRWWRSASPTCRRRTRPRARTPRLDREADGRRARELPGRNAERRSLERPLTRIPELG